MPVETSSVDAALDRLTWQDVLFAAEPKRLDLMRLQPAWPLSPLAVRVHRNHAFEHLASVAAPWLAWWGRRLEALHSDYDDSFSFESVPEGRFHAEILWIDLDAYASRQSATDTSSWLVGRIEALRRRSSAPILVMPVGAHLDPIGLRAAVQGIPGARIANTASVATELGGRFWDERAAKYSGTRVSDRANIELARRLSCHWLPAMLEPRIKGVALDLDYTLYPWALGEDGLASELPPNFKELQQHLVTLRESGVFLACVSKNEQSDVENLLKSRADFPIRWEHFSATSIHWAPKPDGIAEVAAKLRIGIDSLLFVDDNPGELGEVAIRYKGLRLLRASPDAALTRRALEYYPGLWAWEHQASDAVRVADLGANEERSRLAAESEDDGSYLRSLKLRIQIDISEPRHVARAHELSQKTNQFNLALRRYSETQIAELARDPQVRIATVSLSDRLSDSGIVALLVGRRDGSILLIEELAISCRALGRRVESLMVAKGVAAILASLPADRIEMRFEAGERNAPARSWLKELTADTLSPLGREDVTNPIGRILAVPSPVEIHIIHHDATRS